MFLSEPTVITHIPPAIILKVTEVDVQVLTSHRAFFESLNCSKIICSVVGIGALKSCEWVIANQKKVSLEQLTLSSNDFTLDPLESQICYEPHIT